MSDSTGRLITDVSVDEYFSRAVHAAVQNRDTPISGETSVYLGHLLTRFLNTEHLYDATPDGMAIRPLAMLYGDAMQAPSLEARISGLRRLGDVALFIAGLFSHSLGRSLVDVDYYIAMGGNAYGCIADNGHRHRHARRLREVFLELAGRFTECMDVLADVGESSGLHNDTDVLRLYEIWLGSGSTRAAQKLRALGIEPVSLQRRQH